MPLEKIFTAFILGLSWERALYCPFLALGLSLSDRFAGLKFILGRLFGIALLGLMITLAGIPFNIPEKIIDFIFGVFLILLGLNAFLKTEPKKHKQQFSNAGFGLGLFRGLLNPGRKIICLLPLLWGTSMLDGIAISLVYAMSSSVYLLVGFFSAEVLNKIFSRRKQIGLIGGFILIILGVFYLLKPEYFT